MTVVRSKHHLATKAQATKNNEFVVGVLASYCFIALVPSDALTIQSNISMVHTISSLFVIYFFAKSLSYGESVVSAQSFLFLIWFLRLFLPTLFDASVLAANPILLMVGMTDPAQFHLAGLLSNAAVISSLAAMNLFARPGIARIIQAPMGGLTWQRLALASIMIFFISWVSILAFIAVNSTSIDSAIEGGSIRSSTVVSGSGYLWFVGLGVIPASLVYLFADFQISKRWRLLALAPAIIAFATLAILGGRVRAIIPVVAASVLIIGAERLDRPSFRSLLLVAGGVVVLLLWLTIGSVYRSYGLAGVSSLSAVDFVNYAGWSIVGELGQLHGPYIAYAHGEGVMEGSSFVSFAWPLSDMLGWGARNTGVLARDLATSDEYASSWGFHSTAVGDVIFNLTRWGIPPVFVCFGVVLGFVQSSRRKGLLSVPIAILATIAMLRMFSESIDKVQELYVYVGFVIAMCWVARLLPGHVGGAQSHMSPTRRRPNRPPPA